MKYKVIKYRKNEVINPIKLVKGDKVVFIEKSQNIDGWGGWIKCRTDIYEGWVPHQIINESFVSTEDYDATELELEIGEVIIKLEELNGWILGIKEENHLKGWAPLNCLAKLDEV